MSEVVIEHDLRSLFGAARDQGLRPTCLAFAVSDTHAGVRNGWDPLSCEYLYYHAITRDGSDPEAGASVHPTLQAIEHDGQPVEDEWPYLTAVPVDPSDWTPPDDVEEVFCRSGAIQPSTFDAAWELLAKGRPAVIGMTISDAFYQPDAGIIKAQEAVDPARRHAVIGIAAGRLANARALLLRNSWGRAWGEDGCAWVLEGYMSPRIVTVVSLAEAA